MVVGLISDTHLQPRKPLPDQVFDAFAGVDLILHAGDLNSLDVLDVLGALAPVQAVHGNTDPSDVVNRLPETLRLELEGVVVGVTHGHWGRGATTPARAASHFPDARVVVFGHSHIPLIEKRDGVLMVNPGSPTDKRRMPTYSVARLTLGADPPHAELISW